MPRRLLAAAALFVLSAVARPEIHLDVPDGAAVERAQVIVVARLVAGTIEYVPHAAKNPTYGRSWEHHVTIDVSEVVKGDVAPGEHRVILHYGLTPLVGGQWDQAGGEIHLPGRAPEVVEIVGDLMRGCAWGDPADDVRADHVWLLRSAPSGGPGADGKAMLGITDPEDLWPRGRLDYLRLYLADDPEPGLRAHVQEHPADVGRVLPYLEHREVQRVIADPDPARRVERLLPYYGSYVLWCGLDEVGDAIEAAGEAAVPYLLSVIDDGNLYESLRTEALLMLGRIGSSRAVAPLVAYLESRETALSGVARSGVVDDATRCRPGVRERLSELRSVVYALGSIRDPAALPAVRRVAGTWVPLLPADDELREVCERSLANLERAQAATRDAPDRPR